MGRCALSDKAGGNMGMCVWVGAIKWISEFYIAKVTAMPCEGRDQSTRKRRLEEED